MNKRILKTQSTGKPLFSLPLIIELAILFNNDFILTEYVCQSFSGLSEIYLHGCCLANHVVKNNPNFH